MPEWPKIFEGSKCNCVFQPLLGSTVALSLILFSLSAYLFITVSQINTVKESQLLWDSFRQMHLSASMLVTFGTVVFLVALILLIHAVFLAWAIYWQITQAMARDTYKTLFAEWAEVNYSDVTGYDTTINWYEVAESTKTDPFLGATYETGAGYLENPDKSYEYEYSYYSSYSTHDYDHNAMSEAEPAEVAQPTEVTQPAEEGSPYPTMIEVPKRESLKSDPEKRQLPKRHRKHKRQRSIMPAHYIPKKKLLFLTCPSCSGGRSRKEALFAHSQDDQGGRQSTTCSVTSHCCECCWFFDCECHCPYCAHVVHSQTRQLSERFVHVHPMKHRARPAPAARLYTCPSCPSGHGNITRVSHHQNRQELSVATCSLEAH